jgi:HPt (histidine-containing phosphotransfer) domain-containing protein
MATVQHPSPAPLVHGANFLDATAARGDARAVPPLPDPLKPERTGPAIDAVELPVVLDPQALDKLRMLDPGGSAGILARVLRTYEGSLGRLMQQFDAAAETEDFATLRHVAHTLRSSSASVGAMAMAQVCGTVEALARDGQGQALKPAVREMQHESRRAAEAVRAMLAGQGSDR